MDVGDVLAQIQIQMVLSLGVCGCGSCVSFRLKSDAVSFRWDVKEMSSCPYTHESHEWCKHGLKRSKNSPLGQWGAGYKHINICEGNPSNRLTERLVSWSWSRLKLRKRNSGGTHSICGSWQAQKRAGEKKSSDVIFIYFFCRSRSRDVHVLILTGSRILNLKWELNEIES